MTNTYVQNTPQGNQRPSSSYPQIAANFQYLQSFGSTDHEFTTNDGTANDGTHKKVTLNNQGGDPGFVGADSVVYAKSDGVNSQLYFKNAVGVTQLTGGTVVPSAATTGYTLLPGGILLQWGQASGMYKNGSVKVSFGTPFSSIPYSITYSINLPSIPSFGADIAIDNSKTTTLEFYPVNGDSNSRTILWIAIGPA